MDSGAVAWMLTATALVLVMSPGLALFYGGMVRSKNVLSIFMQVFMCMALGTMLWVAVGYSLAFGDSILGGFVGNPTDFPFLRDVRGVDDTINVVFQMMFAIITPALIVGAFAERMRFPAFLVYTALWSLLVYPVVAHWVWGGGWLAEQIGGIDFAGGTVVHINAGIAGLVTAIVIGRRTGWPRRAMPPHNLTLTLLGAGLLWFGWFGFNAGSAYGANEQAVRALLVTQISAAAGAFAWAMAEWVRGGHATTLGAASGAIAGLVAITPAAGSTGVAGSLLIGLLAGVLCYLAVGLKTRFGYDDSLDVVGVHFVGGLIGALLTGVLTLGFVRADAFGSEVSGGIQLLAAQAVGIAVVVAYSGVLTWLILQVARLVPGGLRASESEELQGLDLAEFSEDGYIFQELGSETVGSSLGMREPL